MNPIHIYLPSFLMHRNSRFLKNYTEKYPWIPCDDEDDVSILFETPDLFITENRSNKNLFHLLLKVDGFRREEITVTADLDMVAIECQHSERARDGGWESCKIVRRVPIPVGVEPNTIEHWLSKDGTLTILAPIARILEFVVPKKQQQQKKKQQKKIKQKERQSREQAVFQVQAITEQDSSTEDLQSAQSILDAFRALVSQPSCSSWNDNIFLYPDEADYDPSGGQLYQVGEEAGPSQKAGPNNNIYDSRDSSSDEFLDLIYPLFDESSEPANPKVTPGD